MADLPSGRDLIIDVGAKEEKDIGNWYGKSKLRLENFGQLHTDIYGLSTATATWIASQDTDGPWYPSLFSTHPIWTFCRMEKRTVTIDNGMIRTVGEYAGFEVKPVPVIEYSTGVNEEPIQTHPNFASFAGTPSSPLNGAIFVDPTTNEISSDDSVGVFERFWSNPPNQFSGVTSYLMPVLVQRITTIDSAPDASIAQVGQLQGSMLCTNVTVSQRGQVFQTTVELRSGGPRGWNTDIYG